MRGGAADDGLPQLDRAAAATASPYASGSPTHSASPSREDTYAPWFANPLGQVAGEPLEAVVRDAVAAPVVELECAAARAAEAFAAAVTAATAAGTLAWLASSVAGVEGCFGATSSD